MAFTITCRDCKAEFQSKSELSKLCQPCKVQIRREHQNGYAKTRRVRRSKKYVAPVKKVIITEAEQHAINKKVDDSGVTVDTGRSLLGTPEFEAVARQYYRREGISA